MPVTLTTNYRQIFAPDTLEKIDELIEQNFDLDSILEFIDNVNEKDFVNFYEDYVDQGEKLGYDVVDAWVEHCGDFDQVAECEDAYYGEYSSESDFAEEYMSELYDIPSSIVVDWESTWETTLRYDFDYQDGYIFRTHYW